MTYRVFHAKEVRDERGVVTGIKGRFGFDATTFPDDFRHVADVEAPAIGAVFELTNHIDHPWTENDAVSIPGRVDARTLRSTSVGDIVQDRNKFYAVAPTGFVLLATLDEWFQTRVPALYE